MTYKQAENTLRKLGHFNRAGARSLLRYARREGGVATWLTLPSRGVNIRVLINTQARGYTFRYDGAITQ
jgi:hypothetical protein